MLRFETHEAIAVITFDNGRLNIFTRAFHERLHRSLLRFLRDDSLKVAILTCPPGTSFSAGDDLKTVDEPFLDEPDWSELTLLLPRNKPVIGATRGHCLGQGLVNLLLLTDIRFCTPDATFGFPEIKYGMGGAAAVSRLAKQIPPTIAMRMTLTGAPLNAAEAAACHLVNEVVPDGQLLECALSEAQKIAAHPLEALKAEMTPLARLGAVEHPFITQALFSELLAQQRDKPT